MVLIIQSQNSTIILVRTLEATTVNILLSDDRPPVDVTTSSVLLACALYTSCRDWCAVCLHPWERLCHSHPHCLFFDLCIRCIRLSFGWLCKWSRVLWGKARRRRWKIHTGTRSMREVAGELHQRELIRISLSQAITLLLTFHLTFSRTNLPTTRRDGQRDREEVLDLG